MKETGDTFLALFFALTVTLTVAIGCDNSIASTGSPAGGSPADGGLESEPAEPPITGEVDIPEGSDAGTLSIVIREVWDASTGSGGAYGVRDARSVSGVDSQDIVNHGLRNIYQLVAVDDANPAKIWDFDQTTLSDLKVKVVVRAGRTYHLLLLTGYQDLAHPTDPPTLLASGYVKAVMREGQNTIEFPMSPIVIGVEAVPDGNPSDIRQPTPLARTVGLDKGTRYILRYTISSTQTGARFPDDALRNVSGDGLAPLKLAQNAVFAGRENWPGLTVLANYAVYASDMDTSDDLPDYNDVYREQPPVEHTTTGVAEYLLEPSATAPANTTSKVYFQMECAPFSMGDFASAWADDWAEFSAVYNHWVPDTPPLSPPTWVIRNGLNDDEQDDATDFTAAASADGAISIGVVDPADPLAGLFVDNNPWPIGGPDIYWQEDGTMPAAVGSPDYKPTLEKALTLLNTLLDTPGNRYDNYTIRVRDGNRQRH